MGMCHSRSMIFRNFQCESGNPFRGNELFTLNKMHPSDCMHGVGIRFSHGWETLHVPTVGKRSGKLRFPTVGIAPFHTRGNQVKFPVYVHYVFCTNKKPVKFYILSNSRLILPLAKDSKQEKKTTLFHGNIWCGFRQCVHSL